jgi:hypothetical protein
VLPLRPPKVMPSGGVLALPPSNKAAREAVLNGRAVACVELEPLRSNEGRRAGEAGWSRAGEAGRSAGATVPLVLSHEGGFGERVPAVDWRRSTGEEAVAGPSRGLRGELVGVEGRAVAGEGASRMEPGRRKGDWRGLLKERGEGL